MKIRLGILFIVTFFILFSNLSITTSTNLNESPLVPSPPVENGTGSKLDVYEFIKNQSKTFYNVQNNTAFLYLTDWYPTLYRGYHLHADIQNVRKTVNPVPNGNFEQYAEPNNNWTLTDSGSGLVNSISNTSGGNPGSCLDIELAYSKLLFQRNAKIANSFVYTSTLPSDHLRLYFDVRFSTDITIAEWLYVQVSIETDLGETVALWVTTTSNNHQTSWNTISVPSGPVNGSLILKITIIKTDGGNLDVDGHIFFDNFNYQIGSYATPSEVGLSLNGTLIEDTFANYGEVDIYADPALKKEVDFSNAWNTTQHFIFNSTLSISFDFAYTMAMKSENPDIADTFYNIEANSKALWLINYTIPSGRPPENFSNYQYGVYLEQGWNLTGVRDKSGGNVKDYSYNASTNFIVLNEGIGEPGDFFTISAQGLNYITGVFIQKTSSPSGPWENITNDDYLSAGDNIRVFATLLPIAPTGNVGEILLELANGTICIIDSNPTFNSMTNTLTSRNWEIPSLCEEFAGKDCSVIVSYSSGAQCGLKTQALTIMNQIRIILVTPVPNSEIGWETFPITVYIQNLIATENITDAKVRLRFTGQQGQNQSVDMSLNAQGLFSTQFSTESFEAESSINFYVEFFKQGYINATYEDGNAFQFSIIVNTGIPREAKIINQLIFYAILLVIIIISAWLLYSKVYQQRYRIPKQLAHEKTLQDVLAIYNDVTNISRFLVLHRGSGIALFDSFGEKGRDGSLIGGFLQAIQAFSLDVNDEQKLKETAKLSEITYEGFRVLINDGQYVRAALVYRGTPSETLREKLSLFTQQFEDQYQQELVSHKDEPRRFQKTADLLEEIFHVSLLFPHKVESKTSEIDLSNLESRLHFLALDLTKQSEYVFLSAIVNEYLETVQENPVELLNGLFKLREKQLLIPIKSTSSTQSSE